MLKKFLIFFGSIFIFAFLVKVSLTHHSNSKNSNNNDLKVDPKLFNLPENAVEVPEKRTEKTATFSLGGGHFVTTSNSSPIFTPDENKKLVPLESFGKKIDNKFIFNRLPNRVHVAIDLNHPEYTQEQDGYSFTLSYAINVPGFIENENTVAYKLADGVTLRWEVVEDRVKKTITVEKPGSLPDLSFAIDTSKNLVQRLENNLIYFEDINSKKTIFLTEHPFLADAQWTTLPETVAIVETSSGKYNYQFEQENLLYPYILDPSSGPNSSAAIANDNSIGTVAWTNAGNVASSDNARATAVLTNETSNYINTTDYGFSIPADGTIDGIVAEIERRQTANADINDNSVRLVKGGTVQGNDKATATEWTTAESYFTYGSSTDLWGLTWTYSDINAADFGFVLSAFGVSGGTGSVDHMRLTVYYSTDVTAPTVSSVTSSTANGSYKAGDVVAVTVTFSEAVTVDTAGGTPYLTLETGGNDRNVAYSSGSGGTTLTFNYTVQAGDTTSDLDYVATNSLVLNGGTIRDAALNNATLTLASPGAANSLGANKAIIIDTTAPTVSSVSSSTANGSYKAGDVVAVTVTFSEAVTVNTAGGTPYLTLETGGTDRNVAYSSGSGGTTLTFNYTVQAGDTSSDLDYVATNSLVLNSGTIKDAALNNATLTLASPGAANSLGANKAIIIDTTAPTVSSVSSSTANGSYKAGDVIAVTVTFSETITVNTAGGTPYITLETGGTDRDVAYSSGSGGTTLTFNYTVQAGDTTSDLDYVATNSLVLNSGAITDTAGNDATLTLASPGAANSLGANKAIVIDTTAPTVSSVSSSTANGSYKAGDVIAVTVTFSEAVTVNTAGGTPYLTLETGGTDRDVDYSSGSGGTTLTFNYTVQAGDITSDLDYVATNSLVLNSGTIRDTALNNATLTLASPGAANSLGANKAIIIDTTAPTVSSVSSSTANGSYKAGDVIAVTVTFTEAVTVNTAGGTPYITLETGGTDRNVDYSSGSGGTTLTFSYTVQAGDTTSDLDYVATNSLVLNSGTIKDAALNNATLTLASPGAANSLGANKAIIIDTTAPTVAITSSESSPTNTSPIPITITFSESVTGFVVGDITVGNGTAGNFAGSGTTYTADITPSADGAVTVDVNSSVAVDAALNDNTAATQFSITYDTTAPTVSSVSSSTANGSYKAGDVIAVTVTFSEAVTVNTAGGTPYLTLETGGTDRDVDYSSGSGGTTLTFNYTVQAGDTTSDLDYVATNSLVLNGGTIRDAATNNATLTLASPGAANSLGDNKAIIIDTTAPTVAITSTESSPTNTSPIPITITFNESVTGFVVGDIDVGNGTAGNFAGSGTTYTADITPSADGAVTVDANSSVAVDAAGNGNTAATQFSITYDSTAATVSNVTSSTANGSYKAGDVIAVTVTFSEAVTVNTAGGTPSITLETGGTDRNVDYSSGSGGTTLTFNYTVQAGDTSSDLDYVATNSLVLNSGTIRDAALNNATLTLASPGAANSLGANKAIIIDTTAPTVAITSSESSPTNTSPIPITITFSESVTGFVIGDIDVGNGTAGNFAGSGTTYTADITPSADGAVTVDVNSSVAVDAAGNGNTAATQFSITYDTTAPTVSSVSSSTANGSYKAGDVIAVTVTFSEAVTVNTAGGTPYITLETGGTDRNVDYSSGSGGATLTFNYTVQAGDTTSDLDYVATNSLDLNSGAITDTAGNDATLTLASPGAANSLGANKAIVIDTTAPTVSSVSSSTANGSYKAGDVIAVTVTFSEAVTVNTAGGTPYLTLETGGTDRDVDYSSGSGGTTLTFNYTVQAGDTTSDLDYVATSSLVLNSGTIRDTALNNATLTLASPGAANSLGANKAIIIDTTAPTVSSVSSSTANGSYKAGDVIAVTVTFTEAVTVNTAGGTPSITLETGGTDRNVDYSSGSGGTTLTFSYTVQAGDTSSDLDYVATNSLVLNSGTIKDAALNNATLTLASPGAANSLGANKAIVIDTTAPTVAITSSASSPTNTSPIPITITFNESVTGFVVGDITVGNGTAGNFAGSGTTYTADITPSADGAVTVDVNSSVAVDAAGNGNTAATQFSITYDTTAPTVSSVSSSTANGSYKAGDVIAVTVTFSEAVTVNTAGGTPYITLETGGTDRDIDYSSGSGGTTLTFNYTVQAGDTTSDLDYVATNSLVLNSGTIRDAATNNATLTLASPGASNSLGANKAIIIDTTAPTVSSVSSSTANGSYKAGDVIAVTVTFSEAVTVNTAGGTPYITLETGGTDRNVDYSSGSGGTTLTFSYTVQAGDTSSDLDYVATNSLVLNSGTIRDAALNNATLTLASPGAANSLGANKAIVIDTTAPTVSSVSSSTANGSYKAGDVIAVTVTFSEAVTVNTAGGTPYITLETGGTDRNVDYSSGSGGATLTFSYTVQAGDTSSDLDYVATNSLVLNSGTIKDAALNNATLTLASPGAANSLGANKAIVIDTTAPTVAITSSASSPTNTSPIPITITFNESVTGFVVGDITVGNGTAGNFAGSGTTYTADITPSADGAVTVDVNSSVAVDAAGNGNTAATQFSITYDSTAATVSNVTSSTANGSYKAGDVIAVTVTFSEAVTVNTAGGTPYITLETGSTDRNVAYSSGSGGTTLTFNYTVQAGDTSSDLDYVATNSLVLNSGTIKDAALNNATLTLASPGAAGSLGNNKALIIDTTAPTVAITSSASSPTSTSPIPITITFNESVTGFVIGDIDVGNGTAGNFAGSGTTYTADITPSADGAVTVDVNSSVAVDAAGNGNTAATQFSITYDTTAPTVSSVSSSTANESYKTGDVIAVTVTFSEAVTVNTAGGTPYLTLETGGTDRNVAYSSGSGGTTLTFNYTVQAGDTSSDLDYVATNSLVLNSGTIKDAALNNATLTLASPGAAGSLGNNKALIIDTTAPTVAITSSASSPTSTSPIPITITFNESVTGFVVGDITVGNGTAGNFAGSGTTYTADITPSADGAVTVDVNSSVAVDAAGNGNTAATQFSITYDSTAATVSNVTSSTANGSYKAGDVIAVTVTFSEAVTVNTAGGTPSITLETGGTDRNVDYSSGSGGTTLTFSYTVQAGDTSSDLDYVATNSLVLNSGTIRDAALNNATLTLASPGAANSLGANKAIVIDTTAPTVAITSSASSPTNTSPIPITITFNESVTGFVVGDITVGNGTAGNFAGSGTTYTADITPSADGAVTVDVNSSVAVDAAGNGNTAATQFSITYDSTAATVSNVTSSTANGSYKAGDVIAVTVTFSEAVTVNTAGGTPYLTLETGSTDRNVAYSSGSGGTTLTFNYTVQAGDTSSDLDYVATNSLVLNSGTIRDAATNNATLTLASPGAANSLGANKAIIIDTTAPTVSSVSSSTANGSYKAGDVIAVTVTFSEAVTVNTAGGTPYITLETGGTDRNVDYSSGSGGTTLTFSYTVQAGDTSSDLDYVATNSLVLNSGTIKDAALNNATLTLASPGAANSLGANKAIVIDTTAPTVAITSSASSPTNTSPIPITITFNESVTGFVVGDIDVGNGTAGNFAGSGTTYTADITPSADGAVTVDVNSSVAVDAAGNGNTAATQFSITYDSTAATVSNVTSSTANGSYKAGDVIAVTVTFSEAVTVNTAGGTPYITLETGSTDRNVAYSSGSGGTTLTFNYTVQAGDITSDLDYVATNSLVLNGGTIRDAASNNATLTLASPGAANSLGANKAIVIDTTAPTVAITSIESSPTNTSPIPITITFNESVTGFVVGDITVGNGTAGNFAGSGTTYTADVTPSGDGAVTVDVNSSVAVDAAGNGNTAATQFSITYDTTAPTVSSVSSSTANGSYNAGDVIAVTVTFSEAVTVNTAGGTPSITLETGGTDRNVDYSSGSGGTTLTFNYTVQAGDTSSDLDYVATNSLALNGGTIKDLVAINATLTLANPGAAGSLRNNKALVIDTTDPTVVITSSASSPTNTSPIPITITFNESVTGFVIGDITVGNGTAGNFAGSGTTYTADITPSADGAVTIDVNSSVATDAAGNNNVAATQFSITYDSTVATVTNVTSSTANGSYKAGDDISIQVVFSEVVNVTGTPRLTLETGTSDALVNYASGSGTNTLTFTYTIASGHTSADLDYVATNSLVLNSGTIRDAASNNATLTLASPGAANSLGANKAIIIDGIAPTVVITSTESSPTNTSPIPITITFNESVTGFVVGDITVGNGTAGNFAGSGTTYTADITPSADGAVTVDVNSGVAVDAAGNGNTAATQFSITYDTTSSTVSSVSSSTANGSYKAGTAISIQVAFSEVVAVTGTPQLTLETGATDRTINYVSGSGGSTLTFTYTVQAGDTSSDLDYGATTSLALNAGTIKDLAGNDATLTLASPGAAGSLGNNKALIVDTTSPTVAITSLEGNPTTSTPISITITFSEPVTSFVLADITVGNGTAGSFAGSGTTYTANITPAADGTVTVDVGSSVAIDAAGNGNTAATQFSITYNSIARVTNVTSSTNNGSYKAGNAISIQVVFSKAVTVTGTPQLTLETGGTDRAISYVSGSGSSTLTFTYTVQSGDTSSDLDYVATTSLALNGGTIRDAISNNANLTLVSPGAAGSLGNNKALIVDTTPPTVAITSSANSPTNTSPIPVTITFSESVTGFVVGDITVENGSAGNFAGTGATYTADLTPTAAGAVTVDVSSSVVVDSANNGNSAATQFSITYSSAPSPTPAALTINIDNGSQNTPLSSISGTATEGTIVEVFNYSTSLGTTVANGNGVWTLELSTPLLLGDFSLSVADSNGQSTAPVEISVPQSPLDFNDDGVSDVTLFGKGYVQWASSEESAGDGIILGGRKSQAAGTDYDGDGAADIATLSREGKKNVAWNFYNSETREVSSEFFGTSANSIIIGCNFDNSKEKEMAYINGSQLKYKRQGSFAVTTIDLSSAYNNKNLRGCGDVDSDGIDELLFKTVTVSGKRRKKTYKYNLVAINLNGSVVLEQENVGDFRLAYVADAYGDSTKDILLKMDRKNGARIINIWEIGASSLAQTISVKPDGNFTIGVCKDSNDQFQVCLLYANKQQEIVKYLLKSGETAGLNLPTSGLSIVSSVIIYGSSLGILR